MKIEPLRMICNNRLTFSKNLKRKHMIYKILAPFRAIKNKLLDAIIKRANITASKVALELYNGEISIEIADEVMKNNNFCETIVQIVADNLLDNQSTLDIISDGINYGSLAYEVDLRNLAEYVDLQDLSYSVADQFSPCEIAEHFDPSDIADIIHDRMENTNEESIQEELERLDSNIIELKDLMYEESKLNTEKLKKTSNKVADILQELAREY